MSGHDIDCDCRECALIAKLHDALRDAVELADEGWSYASPYFIKKWGYIEERNKLADIAGMPLFKAQPAMNGHGEVPA